MDGIPALPPLLDPKAYASLVPEGLFYKTEAGQEYQFMLRYITRVLSLIDHSENALTAASKSPIESRFVQPNQEVQSVTSRFNSDARFIAELTMRCCFSLTTVLGALDYMARLQACGAVRLHSTSWKTVFVVCCLLGEKMWEDNYVHPSHIISQFGYLAKGGSNIAKREYLQLQLLLVNVMNWDVNIPLSRYREMVSNIMGVSVPAAVYRTLPAGYAGFVPRPLPPLPKMNLPTQAVSSSSSQQRPRLESKFSSTASTTADFEENKHRYGFFTSSSSSSLSSSQRSTHASPPSG